MDASVAATVGPAVVGVGVVKLLEFIRMRPLPPTRVLTV